MSAATSGTAALIAALSRGHKQREPRWVMKLQNYVFVDDSGKWTGDFICLCAVLSTGNQFDEFEQRWLMRLDQPDLAELGFGQSFHMTQFYQRAAAAKWSDEKVKTVLNSLLKIIREHVVIGMAVGVDTDYYKKMDQWKKDILRNDPALFCFWRMMILIQERMRREQFDGRIFLIVDAEEGTIKKTAELLINLGNRHRDLRHYIAAVTFADDSYVVPIQAADVLANLTSRWFRDRAVGKYRNDELSPELMSLTYDVASGDGIDMRDTWFYDGAELEKAVATMKKQDAERMKTQ